MTSYLFKGQIPQTLKLIMKEAIEECKKSKEIPKGLKDIITYNFNAEFVHLNCEDTTLEIGIKKQDALSLYPKIVTYTYSLEDTDWLKKSIKEEENDLEFYGKVIAQNKGLGSNTEVILY